LAAEPFLIGGREALARNDAAVVRLALFTLEQMTDTGDWVSSAQQEIATPLVERFKTMCRSIREEFESRIVREPQAVKQNIESCRAELIRFRADVEPELNRIMLMLPPGYDGAQEAREEAAILLSAIACDFTWADEFIQSEKLYEEALKLAQETLGSIRIQSQLEKVRASAQQQRVLGKHIKSAPSLGSINGFGFTLYGHSDYDPESHSYSTTHYFIALFLPILPLGRYRVIAAGGRRYRFLGKIPFRAFERWHLGISLSAIGIAILMMIANSSGTNPYSTTTTSSGYTSRPLSSTADSPSRDASFTPATHVPSDSATSSSVPSSASPEADANGAALKSLGERIDAGRSRMTEIESRLKPVADELNSIDEQMKPLKSELDSLKRKQSEGRDVDGDHYNSLVDDYNSLLSRKKALIEANSADFDEYKTQRKEDASMMEQWKALGGKVE
jgi:archaellum component FlaC